MQHRYGKKKARESSSESSSTVDNVSARPREEKQNSQDSHETGSPEGSSQKDSTEGTQPEGSPQAQKSKNSFLQASGQPDTFSINQALKKGQQSRQVREEKTEEEEDAPKETGKDRAGDFTQEQVEEALSSLAEHYREKPRVYNMLRSRKPEKKEDNTILIPLENHLQQEQLNKIYNTVLFHLKNSLQNDYIGLNTKIMKDQTSNNKLYTDEDRYNYMEQKNEYLRRLRQDFDLDFD
ncbi:MAG TPA: hypothetical protein VJ876_05535 [Bacteroidales bacterium]|nr:hypothetical protein [Bacteroidales bacterium]